MPPFRCAERFRFVCGRRAARGLPDRLVAVSMTAALVTATATASAQEAATSAPAPTAPAPATTAAPAPTPATSAAPEQPPGAPAPAPLPAEQPSPAPPIAPLPSPVLTPPLMPAQPPETAFVHMAVDYPSAWLEGRSLVDRGAWQRLCPAPCDRIVAVDGLELRVAAPGMTTSNAFRIEPGSGSARLRVNGGSAGARTAGLVTLIAGLPVALGGMALFGYGSLEESDGLKVGGIVALSAGALAVLVSLPLLFQGSTSVRSEKGSSIARALPPNRSPVLF